MSLIEAQAAGKPVVSTNVGGVSDVVMNEQCGYVTSPGEANEFAAGLLKLIECDEQRKTLGGFGHDFVQNKFSYRRLVRDMSDYYHRLIEERKK